jgi:hypothetical protein
MLVDALEAVGVSTQRHHRQHQHLQANRTRCLIPDLLPIRGQALLKVYIISLFTLFLFLKGILR